MSERVQMSVNSGDRVPSTLETWYTCEKLKKFPPSSCPPLLPPAQPNTSTETLQSITSGDWDVTQVLAYDEDSQLM